MYLSSDTCRPDIRISSNKILIYAIGEEERLKTRHLPQIRCRDPKFARIRRLKSSPPRRNARTYTLPGSGGTFLQKVSRKARSLFRKTSSNVPRRRAVPIPTPPLPFPSLKIPVSRLLPSAALHLDGTLDGILMKSRAVYELPRSAQLWQVICTRAAPGRYPNLFRLSCKLAGMSEVAAIQEAVSWMRISGMNGQ